MNDEYKAICKIEYSKDVWARGWNIKLRKADGLALQMSEGIQKIYWDAKAENGQRWLMINLHSNDSIYQDTLKLIRVRRGSK